MEQILSTYQDITAVIKDSTVREVIALSSEFELQPDQVQKLIHVIDSTITQHSVNGYEVLQNVIVSRTKSTGSRTRGKTK